MKHSIKFEESELMALMSALRVRMAFEGESVKLARRFGWDVSNSKRQIALFAKLYARVRKQVFRSK